MKKKRFCSQIALFVIIFASGQLARAQSDTLVIETPTDILTESVMKKFSPHKASMYSAVLPGLGQAYNKKYWKIPILYAGFAGLAYAIDWNSSMYSKYRNAYRDFVIQDGVNTSYLTLLEGTTISADDVEDDGTYSDWFENTLENGKDYYKKWRNLSYVGLALVYVINIIDASVDAHFKTFDVSNDLSMRVEPIVNPGYGGNSMGLQLKIVF